MEGKQWKLNTTASLACMFDWYCGVLKDNSVTSRLIYFELIDVVAKPPYDLKELLTMMVDKEFTLNIVARKEGTPGMAIQYVVFRKSISIIGKDKHKKYSIQRLSLPKIKFKGHQYRRMC